MKISDEMKTRINHIIKMTAQETIRTMFVRIVDGDNFLDVAPEVATCLQRKKLVYFCGHCSDLHVADGVAWKTIKEQIELMMN